MTDRHLFSDTIGQMAKRFDNDIFACVLMDNIITCCFAHKKPIYPEACNGFIYGPQKFVDHIKKSYSNLEPDPVIAQQKSIIKDSDPAALLNKASKVLQCDLERIKNSPRARELGCMISQVFSAILDSRYVGVITTSKSRFIENP